MTTTKKYSSKQELKGELHELIGFIQALSRVPVATMIRDIRPDLDPKFIYRVVNYHTASKEVNEILKEILIKLKNQI